MVAEGLRQGKRGVAMLARSKKFSRAALLQIALGDFKAVRCGDHRLDAFLCIAGDGFRRDEYAMRFFRAAADAPAKLVKLSEAKAIGMLDHHYGRVRDIHADFDNRGGDQNLQLVAAEALHDGIFFFVLEAPMQQADAKLREDLLRQALIFRRGRFKLLLRLLDDGIEDIRLPPAFDFAAQKFPNGAQLVCGFPARFDWRAARRHFVNHGKIEIAVERERKGARNGSGGHYQHVGRRNALFDESLALQYAEAVLLVHNHKSKTLELHRVFDQGVRAHHELSFTAFHFFRRAFLIRAFPAAHDELDFITRGLKNSARGKVMLRR